MPSVNVYLGECTVYRKSAINPDTVCTVCVDSLVEVNLIKTFAATNGTLDTKLNRALELIGGSIDPEIAETYASIEERILAQALENVELAERRLREIQKLVGDRDAVLV